MSVAVIGNRHMAFGIGREMWVSPLGLALLACASGPISLPGEDSGADGGLEAAVEAGVCDGVFDPATTVAGGSELQFNEVVSSNDGVWVDELGETDDWFELVNTGDSALDLAAFFVSDGTGNSARLPARTLGPGEYLVLWADDTPQQGELHMPFKLSASGDSLTLWRECAPVAHLELPGLDPNQAFSRFPDAEGEFSRCRYTSAGRDNGQQCEPPARPEFTEAVSFETFDWPDSWPPLAGPLRITELALRPARFVEVLNAGDRPVALDEFVLRIAELAPGLEFPDSTQGTAIDWPAERLEPGERIMIPIAPEATAALDASTEFEGVLSVFDVNGASVSDRIDFAQWPADAVLARYPEGTNPLRFCRNASPGSANSSCDELPARAVGDRVHRLATPGDFSALAAGGTDIGQEGVKFIVDMQAADSVHLLGAEAWALHYTFIRERIYGEPQLDRCDPLDAREFNQGWYEFSQREYYRTEGRRFLLGTLVRHASGAQTVEFNSGDLISPDQMRRGFFAVAARTQDPTAWTLRMADERQINIGRILEGTVPMVGPNAPFEGLNYQPLSATVGYGELRFIPASELQNTALGPRMLVVTDDVPNDIPFVGGLITEAFQTPLAHVNVLSQARGTPNMALRHARSHAQLAPWFGKLVRLEVGASRFDVREATAVEADAFWRDRNASRPVIEPTFDTSLRGVVPLTERGIADMPAIGAKAAQFAELHRVETRRSSCPSTTVPLNVPADAFAIPVAHYFDHLAASGAQALLEERLADPEFRADPLTHEQGLEAVRQSLLHHPVEPSLLAEVTAAVDTRFGSRRVRFRSSSNTEDLPAFNGAGLHTSISAERGNPERSIEDALRTVWASLWNTRAFDEREFANLAQTASAMGILVHAAHLGEAAQGVAISRNLLHLTRGDIYYINAQIGEATVTNPAPGVTTEELLYAWPPRSPRIAYQARSSLTPETVLTTSDVDNVACALSAVHEHFAPLLNSSGENRLFAMQIEFKVLRDSRTVVVKQARPQRFGDVSVPADCREF